MPNNNIPNRLSKEKSPYLLQHANNPVNWFPWRDEAFRKAKSENKPVFLTIALLGTADFGVDYALVTDGNMITITLKQQKVL